MNDYEKEHLAKLRQSSAECTLMLKSSGTFPLREAGEIGLYGSGIRHTVKGGTGSGEVNSRFFTTVEQGMLDAGFTVTTGSWLDFYDAVREEAFREFVRQVRIQAKENHTNAIIAGMGAVMAEPEYDIPIEKTCDTAIYVLSRISGEGNDRKTVPGDVLLTETEKRDILKLQEIYPNFLLALNVGGPVDLSPVADRVENILLLSQLGVETGAILADLILGKSYPSGKLTTTWAAAGDYCDLGDFGNPDETRYKEGIYVGYRYFDAVGKQAMFPFGFGLGYTTFSVGAGAVTAEGSKITVAAQVINTGSFAGKETVQLYVSSPAGALDKPYQALAGFAKTPELRPGQGCQVEIRFDMTELASFDPSRGAWVLEAGDYIIRLGTNSVSTVAAAVLRLDGTVVTMQVKNRLGAPDFTDWRPEPREMVCTDAPVVSVRTADILTETAVYDGTYTVDPLVEKLTDEELAYLAVGGFNPKGGIADVIGSASTSVAGAAGETCGLLRDQGFPVMVMADGPAGIRISREYYTDEKGNHGLGKAIPETMLPFLPGIVKFFVDRPPKMKKGVEIREQYATAIPIGTAIAQSFNTAFAESCGDIVGSEMERFGIQLWLAPALNIHRDIRCGRNFEYYSEDPLVSGRMAAAITRGVQTHPGCGTTIKHFAANSQETNRYNNNSLVSERALREIYLRGFGICVREAQPCALMTSYNLINGVHTSESRELTEDILRSEFGFEGIVMTDWVVGGSFLYNSKKYPMPNAGKVAAAGGDLFMPGSKGDWKRCMKQLKSGVLSRRQLEINATRILHMARRLIREP